LPNGRFLLREGVFDKCNTLDLATPFNAGTKTMSVNLHDKPSCVIYSSLTEPTGLHRDGGFAPVTCPDCGKPSLKRIRRRRVDRLVSMFAASRRFACRDIRCQWVGNLTRNSAGHVAASFSPVHVVLTTATLLTLVIGAELLRG